MSVNIFLIRHLLDLASTGQSFWIQKEFSLCVYQHTFFNVFDWIISALQRKPDDINTKAADMWSFAILLWELETREVPFAELSSMEVGMKVTSNSLSLALSPSAFLFLRG